MSKPYSFNVHIQESDEGFWAIGQFRNFNDRSKTERKKKQWTDTEGLETAMNQIHTWLSNKIAEAEADASE